MSAEDFPYPIDHIFLCGITFDINDVVDDFDFVYFTNHYAPLDSKRDGISDLYFGGRRQNYLEWTSPGGCVNVNLRECWGNRFNPNCGYAMMSIQPKDGSADGRASIPVLVTLRYQPNSPEFTKKASVLHTYSDCLPQPDFRVQKKVDNECKNVDSKGEANFNYTITVYNKSSIADSLTLTDILPKDVATGQLVLSYLNIECPSKAICGLWRKEEEELQITMADLPPNNFIKITYTLTAKGFEKLSSGQVINFDGTASVLKGTSNQISISVASNQVAISIAKDRCSPTAPQTSSGTTIGGGGVPPPLQTPSVTLTVTPASSGALPGGGVSPPPLQTPVR